MKILGRILVGIGLIFFIVFFMNPMNAAPAWHYGGAAIALALAAFALPSALYKE